MFDCEWLGCAGPVTVWLLGACMVVMVKVLEGLVQLLAVLCFAKAGRCSAQLGLSQSTAVLGRWLCGQLMRG